MNMPELTAIDPKQRRQFCRRKLLLTLAGLAAGFLAGVAMAAETKTSDAAPLRVGVSPVFPPMIFKQGKELAGVEVDLARALGQSLGRPVVFVEVDWKDQTDALVAGKTDIIMSSMSMTMSRNAVLSFTSPYFKIWQMALVRREDRNQHLLGTRIPPGTKVGVIKATTGDFLIQREFPKASRKVYANGTEAAKALKKGSVDLFLSDSTLVWYLAGTHAADGLTVAPLPLNEEHLAWGVRRGNDELLKAANEFIARGNQDGSIMKIFRRWMAVE
jgi:ABC-type amino acid transport substrate-binding protein